MNKKITITTCQNKVILGNIESNYNEILKLIKDNKDSKLVVFPLLSLTGYSCGELFNQKYFLNQAKEYLLKLVKEVNNTAIVSLPLEYFEKKYICNVIISNRSIIGVVPKICLNNYEKKFFNDGKEIKDEIIELGKKAIFSFDFSFEDESKISLGFNNLTSDIILVPACDKTTLKSNDYIDKLYKKVSKYSKVIYLNSSNDTSTNFLVIPRVALYNDGDLVKSKYFENNNSTYRFDLKVDIKEKKYSNLFIDLINDKQINSFDINKEIINQLPFINEYKNKYLDVISLQSKALVTRSRNTNIFNLIIGVSGGLDSTIALLAIYEARKIEPKIKIYGITMPYEGNTSSKTKSNALELLKLLKCDYIDEIDISKMVNQLLLGIKHDREDVVYENAQARVRTLVLMSIANKYNGMVIGTGDLSEIALGWCTYNGDHMAMYNINSTLPKTLIKKVVNEYALQSNEKIKKVLTSIVNTPISPELTKAINGQISQKSENEIGSYLVNDFILYYLLKYKVDLQTLFDLIYKNFSKLSKDEIKKSMKNFFSRFFSQQFKRNCSPEGATISEYSLSNDVFSLPSDINSSSIIKLIDKL